MLYKTEKSGKSKWETKSFPLNDISDYLLIPISVPNEGKTNLFLLKDIY